MNPNRNYPRIDQLREAIRVALDGWSKGTDADEKARCNACGNSEAEFIEQEYQPHYRPGTAWQKLPFCKNCFPALPSLNDELHARLRDQLERDKTKYRKQEYRNLLKRSMQDVGPRFRGCRFRTYLPREQSQAVALDQLTKWLANAELRKRRPFVLLAGSYGVGKTHLLRAAQRRIGYRESIAKFVNDVELSAAWQQSHERGAVRGPNEIINEVKTWPFLIWDDLGKTKLTEAWSRVVYQVANFRHEQMLPTLISTNCDPTQLATAIGGASADRLLDASNLIISIGGSSMRGAA